MGNTTSYQYTPLQPGEFRLLRLCHTWVTNKLSLEIKTYPLSSCPQYVALSYTWGESTETEDIFLNNKASSIRKNLAAFLRQVRCDADAPGRELFYDANLVEIESDVRYMLPNFDTLGHFWVDALCIDQSNMPERNAQVVMMKRIYEGAEKVVIWLGPAADDSDQAIQLIEKLAQQERKHKSTATSPIDPACWEIIQAHPSAVEAVGKLFHRDWWSRAWILQEATAPTRSRVSVWCGSSRIDWFYVSLANQTFYEAMLQKDFTCFSRIGNGIIMWLAGTKFARHDPAKHYPLDILHLLRFAKSFDCTDPRDKLYSVQSLAFDGQDEDIKPRYEAPVEEVYETFVRHMIRKHDTLDILGFCSVEKYLHTPSWVPDFSNSNIQDPFPTRSWVDQQHGTVYNACASRPANAHFHEEHHIISVFGIDCDEIVDVSEPRMWYEPGDEEQDAQLACTWARFACSGVSHDTSYPSGGTAAEALCHTLCIDISDDDEEFADRGYSAEWPIEEMVTGDPSDVLSSIFTSKMIVHKTTMRRRLFRTKKGYLGIASMHVDIGNRVCVLDGGRVPFVLVQRDDGYWSLLSECYVHGIMDGEAWEVEGMICEQVDIL
ncbi:hypothetical protein LTR86_000440 [Recurvomyces mirabilis]|nr:hypothetical protein LTR86_000440 [Recurvomyces mirabilis]